ncbi:PorT family protein [Carboxylicivirga sediminis]|uniref:PorT family protein n=1 Tax=Carboxylicivirga sediminis TaxID=2006564 RepID=A0A941F7D3_9BACT|nr:porin family protein [Carboxylicivirga sediminis]MBR8538113.1 PorT family protein [Carboxylicivirga sediminis]
MKKPLLLLLFILLANTLCAQVLIALFFGDKLTNDQLEFGLTVGINRATIVNLDARGPNAGLNIGMSFLYKFNERWHLNPMLYYAFPMGSKGIAVYDTPNEDLNAVLETATVKRKMAGFSLPITVRHRLFNLTYLELGPQFSLITKAEDVFTVSLFDDDDLSYTADVSDQYKKIDVGLTVGIAQKLKQTNGITITARYFNSLMNISKAADAAKQYHSVIHVGVIIPFGQPKAEG